jgi:hypothetical protein
MAWFRFHDETVDDLKLHAIAEDLDLPFPWVFGAWAIVLNLANRSSVRGILLVTTTRPLTLRNVSETFHVTLHETETVFQAFQKADMLTLHEDGVWAVTHWSTRQFESDSSTERVRKHRTVKRNWNVSETVQKTEDRSTPQPPKGGVRAAVAMQCNEVQCQPNLTKPNLTQPNYGAEGETLVQLFAPLMPGNVNHSDLTRWLKTMIEQFTEAEVHDAILIARSSENGMRSPKAYVLKVLQGERKKRDAAEEEKWAKNPFRVDTVKDQFLYHTHPDYPDAGSIPVPMAICIACGWYDPDKPDPDIPIYPELSEEEETVNA